MKHWYVKSIFQKRLSGYVVAITLLSLLVGYQNCSDVDLIRLKNDSKLTEITPTPTPEPSPTPNPECGIYQLEMEEFEQAGTPGYRFRATKQEGSEFIPVSPNPIAWSSSASGQSHNQNATYTLLDPARNCSAISVQARITNSCGDEQTITTAFTIAGCPEPQTGNVACGQRHKILGSSAISMGWMQLAGVSSWEYKNISTLRLAYETDEDFITNDAAILVAKNQVFSMKFRTGTPLAGSTVEQRKLSFGIESSGIVSPPGVTAGACPMMISISDCSEDFYIGRETTSGCLSSFDGTAGVLGVIDVKASDNLPAHICKLESNTEYFINITAHDPTRNWAYAKQDDPLTPQDESLESCQAISTIEIRNLAP